MDLIYGIIIGLFTAIFFVSIFFYFEEKKKKSVMGSLDMALFLVMMPKYEVDREGLMQKEEKTLIGQMEQIYTSFLYLKRPGFSNWFRRVFAGPPRIAFEIASQVGGSDISFYVAVPKFLETGFEKYIQGVYPRAIIEKVPQDYTIFEPGGVTAGSYLKLEEPIIFPINTYKNLEKDPLAEITNTLSKIQPDEGASIQIVIRPISQQKLKKIGNKVLVSLKNGKPAKVAIAKASRSWFADFLAGFLDIITGDASKTEEQKAKDREAYQAEGIDERAMQAIQEKIQRQVFEVNIRLVSAAQQKERAQDLLGHLECAFGQFSLSALNSFRPIEIKQKSLQKFIYDYSFRNFNNAHKNILNIEELTSIYHFPTRYIETPYIKSAKGGEAVPPEDLPDTGMSLIGKVTFRGEEKNILFASKNDRRRHFYAVGQTGTGKSSLLRELIRQDVENGEGVAVIDPHGELIEHTLAIIPKERVEDVVLFEPFDLERPVGLNMLEYDNPEQKDFAVQEMIAIFQKLFPPEIIGPMFEHYMRNAMLGLMANKDDPGTMVEIPRMFTDMQFMEEKIKYVSDPLVKSFWLKEWKQTTGETKSEMLGYVVSKVGRFIENDIMRNIIGQTHSGFDLGKIMDDGKIFLANLSKGSTGEMNSSLLGLILVSKMQMAAMKRSNIKEEERKDFYLYIDEFQNFTTDSIATILSEARKYKLNLILAHQYVPQLTDQIRDAVLGNVGTFGAFRVGAGDAEFLEKQFEPEFSRFDLVNLDNFNLVLKLMVNNKIHAPFKMKTMVPKEGNSNIVEPIKKISKLKYGRPKSLVEAEITQRSKLGSL